MLTWPGISTDFWNKGDISIVSEEETSNERVMQENENNR